MRFTPKSEEQLEEENKFKLLEPGIYDFQITEASPEISKKRNDMIKLKLCIYNHDGNTQHIFDYLLESMGYKLRHCADACGLLAKYELGELVPDDFTDKAGKVKVVIQKSKDPQYPDDKNAVADYIKRGNMVDAAPKTAADLDDDIPF